MVFRKLPVLFIAASMLLALPVQCKSLEGKIEHVETIEESLQHSEPSLDVQQPVCIDLEAKETALAAGLPESAEFVAWASVHKVVFELMLGKKRYVWLGRQVNSPLPFKYFRLHPNWTAKWNGAFKTGWCKVKMRRADCTGFYFWCTENSDGPRGWLLPVSTPANEKQRYGVYFDQPN